ncbi:hypothetical protein J5226_15180 [Lysobacter sp. K5869]|uniref:hypothetical protein n=1 Tax=Lysobacter sp. K5869 TaxID=2820808 RepID=UPI001C060F58|nr:hypothetical protein [Lysobacter sp. K5869]QWP74988.1 hypothetical protein J5226_15180 [Lysobacter sp. K5869]
MQPPPAPPAGWAERIEWTDYDGLGRLTLPMPMLGERHEFVLFPADGAPSQATERMGRTIADVLALGAADLAAIETLLWEECLFSFQVADYGVDALPGESSLDAHLREFGVSGPADALAKARLREIQVDDGFAARFARLQYLTVADNLVSVIVKDGRVIDYDDDGTYLRWFEQDERYAHRRRQKVLA